VPANAREDTDTQTEEQETKALDQEGTEERLQIRRRTRSDRPENQILRYACKRNRDVENRHSDHLQIEGHCDGGLRCGYRVLRYIAAVRRAGRRGLARLIPHRRALAIPGGFRGLCQHAIFGRAQCRAHQGKQHGQQRQNAGGASAGARLSDLGRLKHCGTAHLLSQTTQDVSVFAITARRDARHQPAGAILSNTFASN